ncbi:MAG: PTS fructose transporter subunit IIB [Anaerolineae bacterium]|mgnify:FL=1|jgi:galactitol PTS system EIIB component|nr:PTS fructose transporter subunit IIB [Anaerolineae bacterium]MBT7990965.1 PTS fructose transporter subunit IIB [Anaerolineae bacterium]
MDKNKKKVLKILTVCGSGVVSSSMLQVRVKEILANHGMKDVKIFELTPSMIKSHLEREPADLVVSTTKIYDKLDIPVINGVPVFSGIGEDKFIEELVSTAKQILQDKGE